MTYGAKLQEMARDRSDAQKLLMQNGKPFIEHFHKIYSEGVYGINFPHHCAEMQAWFMRCVKTKLQHSNKPIECGDFIKWFFKAGGNLDASQGFTDSVEKRPYILFCEELMSDKGRDLQDIAEYSLTVGVAPNEPTKYDWK